MDIQSVIKKYGYTVKQVSEGLGYASGTLSDIIYNTKNPRYDTLRKVADFLGCHISEFFADEPVTLHGEIVSGEKHPAADQGQPHLRIRTVMRQQGVTSMALGEKLGMSKVGVSLMLKSNNPTVDRLSEIANALGVCVTDLFSYDEKEQ
jgi:transcriptional regulator with XRE-family HTH domain